MKCQGVKNIKRRSFAVLETLAGILNRITYHCNCNLKNRQPKTNVGDVVWSMGVLKSLITERGACHRVTVVRMHVQSGDRVIEITRP